jgi:phage gpG-like protein
MELQIAFDKNSKFQKKLNEVFKATGDLTIPLKLIANEWFRGNKSIFVLKGPGRYKDLSTKPFYARWEKDPSLRKRYEGGYREYKAAKYGSAYPILKATGKLAKSITDPRDGYSIARIINKKTLVLGTSIPYGIYHQSDLPRKKIPYRPFLFLGVEQIAPQDIKNNRVKNWIKILDNFFEQKIKA